jgi:hypothetical protein
MLSGTHQQSTNTWSHPDHLPRHPHLLIYRDLSRETSRILEAMTQ